MFKRLTLSAAALLGGAAPAFAHLAPGEHGSFLAGFSHPLSGLDHMLVMVSVGLWAAMVGGRALWIVPAAFVAAMATGFLAALSGVLLPFVEPVVAASVVALGLLVAAAVRLPVALSATLVGLFAVFHGFAHASELAGAGAASFGAGFAASTALLHLAGIGLGLALASGAGLGEVAGRRLSQGLGAVTAVAGVALMVG